MTELLTASECKETWDEEEETVKQHPPSPTSSPPPLTVTTTITTIKSFDELDIPEALLRGIYSCGYEKPSSIQQIGIQPILSGKDVIAQAQSGTGKTATFCIGGLSRIDYSVQACQLLILSPTRELTMQIAEVVQSLTSMVTPPVKVKVLVGGNRVESDITEMKKETFHVIVGCPGRVNDVFNRGFNATTIKTFIMDEADEMLNIGFKDQICTIFKYLHPEVQVVLFSATLPEETKTITKNFMRNPIEIIVKAENLSLDGIEQFFIAVDGENDKFDKLCEVYKTMPIGQSIVYANSTERVKQLAAMMRSSGFSVIEIYGDIEKRERETIISQFKSGQYRILISTDLTARGIDVQQVSLVVNYDVPRCEHNYLHRIGRSGRWGRLGKAINLVTRRDVPMMEKIEKHYNKAINEYVPTP